MIPDHTVDEVRARADLVEIIGEFVPLNKSGKEWKGQCPFHDDRTPSFYVDPDKGFYKCFGCGESGDVFTFLMKRSGMEFLDAVRSLAGRYGIEIREVTGNQGEEDPFRAHYEANAFAQEWFRRQLLDPEVGKRGRAYLEGRGIGEGAAERFGLGFAPDGWRGLRDAAAQHEIPESLLLEVGLLTTSERQSDPYDRFRNRITFPIESVSGRVVGFGGRTLDKDRTDTPKYLNSPESPIYHKGEVLYALGWSRNAIRREGAALVVEGYMDALALAAHGVENVVATLGTALTPEHALLLRRYTTKALLLFDSDEAGLRATFRAADILLAHGVHPSVVTLPLGEDPDTAVRKEGASGIRRYLDAAVDVFDRKLQLLEEKGFFGSIEKVRSAVDKLLPTLRAVRDPTLRDIYIARTAERTGVRRETLEEEVARSDRAGPGGGFAHPGSQGGSGTFRGGGSRERGAGRPGEKGTHLRQLKLERRRISEGGDRQHSAPLEGPKRRFGA
jgi:DNA primase